MRTLRNALVFIGTAVALVLSNGPSADAHSRPSPVRVALAQVGDPYVYGANGPNAFDCSGLVQYAYSRAGYRHVPRTAAAQARRAHRIAPGHARRGDLLFYYGFGGVYHVAIYLGNHHVVEASHPGTRVHVTSTWQARRFTGRM